MRHAIVLAGGLGTRLRAAVPDLPKPMAPVNGRPFLEYQIDYWIGQGIEHFVLSVGYLHGAITAHFGSRYRDAAIEYAIEETPMGTGGGVLLAASRLTGEGPFLVLNGDTYFEVDLRSLAALHAERDSDWTLALFRSNEAGRYMGLSVAEDGRVHSLEVERGEVGALANGGVYLIEPDCLLHTGARPGDSVSLEQELLPSALRAGASLYGMAFPGGFIDIGVPDDYRRASEMLR
ncbi:nucleotidyltransferase family protein [Trinickia acidisoli]|uniref:nucleotidyltransferase family protein n=1 Tax=Trinickia acidisoli TaxID=2767482 RepID=UPI002852E4AF|nr:nucleotidyltransferase family protein [Trinickia acidisoli]